MKITFSASYFCQAIRLCICGLFALLLLSFQSLYAQQNGAETQVNLRFRVLALEEGVDNVFYRTGSERIVLRAEAFKILPYSMPYRGDPVMQFYRDGVDAVPALGAPVPTAGVDVSRVVGEVNLSPEMKQIILLFIPAAEGSYRVFALPDEPSAVAPGHARLVNLANAAVAVRLTGVGRRLSSLKPGESLVERGQGGKLELEVALEEGGSWRRVLSNTIGLGSEDRSTLFFLRSDSEFFKQRRPDGTVIDESALQMIVVEG